MQIVIVGEVALLVSVDVDVVYDLIVIYHSGECHSAKLVCIEIELVGYKDFFLIQSLLGVNGNDYVYVLNSNLVGALDEDEVIVGIYGIVGNVAYNGVVAYVTLTPLCIAGVVCIIASAPVAAVYSVLMLIVGGKRGACVIVDLLGNGGYVFGNVEYRCKACTVAESS